MRWLIFLLICSPLAVHGGEWHVDKKAEGNQVAFTSKVVAFTFTGTTDKIDGFIYWEGESLFAAKDQLHFEVDLASFDTGIGKRDRDMRQVLGTDQWPKAMYKGEIAEHTAVDSTVAAYRVKTKGILSLHGVDRAVEVPGTVVVEEGRSKVEAAFTIKLADYDIEAPSLAAFVKVNEEIGRRSLVLLKTRKIGQEGLTVSMRVLWLVALLPALAGAQPSWQASVPTEVRLELFSAIKTANYPTAETLSRGDFHYEISHRFSPPIDEGYKANFGFDGPANIRTSLSYGLSDRLMATLGRSNVLDNLDLQLQYHWLQFSHERLPAVVGLNVGMAWNTEMPAIVERNAAAADNFQYFGQLIVNAMLDERLGIGLVPSYLYNSAIFSVETQYTFTLGTYVQYYFDDTWGVWLEYSPTLTGYQGILLPGEAGRSHNSLAWGLSIDTGGHTFYIFATNNTRLSPAQYLVGAPDEAAPLATGAWALELRAFCKALCIVLD